MTDRLQIEFHDGMDGVDASTWDALAGASSPAFVRHAFLRALETSGAVSADNGWQPMHVTATDATGAVVGAMPLYLKYHSWGEFVFDWAWADAYQRAGLAYYPKLVSASPFTPATAPRLLVGEHADSAGIAAALLTATEALARENDLSSLHLQFADETSLAACRQRGYLARKDCQFHWHNHGYASFDDFLGTFSSAKRKKVKRERRRLREAGISFEHIAGGDLAESDIERAYQLTRQTFLVRGREPYLAAGFFQTVADTDPTLLHLVFACCDGRRIAAAIFYRSGDTLYGRYWGTDEEQHSLHFETCYYQGIELAIRDGIQRFEPGTQGEHKVSRGFLPVETHSAHWLSHPAFADAIGQYLVRESEHIDDYVAAVHNHSPYRADDNRE